MVCHSLHSCDLLPGVESVVHGRTILRCAQMVPSWAKMIGNGIKGPEEALRVPA